MLARFVGVGHARGQSSKPHTLLGSEALTSLQAVHPIHGRVMPARTQSCDGTGGAVKDLGL